MRQTMKCLSLLLLLFVFDSESTFSSPQPKTYQHTRRLLAALDDVKNNGDKLAVLFNVGDQRIQDLIQALDDTDGDISLHAQIMIRYLGNAEGMKHLIEWYNKHPTEYKIAGPVPLPLTDWDYKFVDTNLMPRPPETWREIGVRYLYALAIDSSERSQKALQALLKNATPVNENTFVGHTVNQLQTARPNTALSGKDVASLVRENAFFLSSSDRRRTTTRLLALNGTKDKALVEVYINRGRLAEEWYHVVMSKCGRGWKYFSITQISVS
jgi:hypothetical protein